MTDMYINEKDETILKTDGEELEVSTEVMEELDYSFIALEDHILDLYERYSEVKQDDKPLVRVDIRELERLDCDYIFNSLSSNEFIHKDEPRYQELIKEFLDELKKV